MEKPSKNFTLSVRQLSHNLDALALELRLADDSALFDQLMGISDQLSQFADLLEDQARPAEHPRQSAVAKKPRFH